MSTSQGHDRSTPEIGGLSDLALVVLARSGDEQAVRTIVSRHNQRLFRVARSVVHNDSEAEDVVQASYVNAFTHLASFRGDAEFRTWLTRIALNEALGRLKLRRATTELEAIDEERTSAEILQFPLLQPPTNPEAELSREEIRRFLERAVDRLPPAFRAVFVLRDIQGLSIEETARSLDLRSETVRTRLHRARKMLRAEIEERLKSSFETLFPFDGKRCVGMADRVAAELSARQPNR